MTGADPVQTDPVDIAGTWLAEHRGTGRPALK